jgi:hypothetical protein
MMITGMSRDFRLTGVAGTMVEASSSEQVSG